MDEENTFPLQVSTLSDQFSKMLVNIAFWHSPILPPWRAESWEWSGCRSPAWSPSRASWTAPSCPSPCSRASSATWSAVPRLPLSSNQCPGCNLTNWVGRREIATFWQPETLRMLETSERGGVGVTGGDNYQCRLSRQKSRKSNNGLSHWINDL